MQRKENRLAVCMLRVLGTPAAIWISLQCQAEYMELIGIPSVPS